MWRHRPDDQPTRRTSASRAVFNNGVRAAHDCEVTVVLKDERTVLDQLAGRSAKPCKGIVSRTGRTNNIATTARLVVDILLGRRVHGSNRVSGQRHRAAGVEDRRLE